ncbi:hypothetical protein MAIT1_01426 [Magnetofaba australis IT-1]|uniref:Uncharacterized protein n=1 Tax=Magnetofaba australis IT-1 TaxID=1434232 RepID=A0A1Y2K0F8_9PROT|nr:hypothetical protein MAIT1_01426 [Magnetofaba australis IT-1]
MRSEAFTGHVGVLLPRQSQRVRGGAGGGIHFELHGGLSCSGRGVGGGAARPPCMRHEIMTLPRRAVRVYQGAPRRLLHGGKPTASNREH